MKTGAVVAIKLEPVDAKQPQLIYESKLYSLFEGSSAVPTPHWSGTDQGYNVLVMDLMGPSLLDLGMFWGAAQPSYW